MADRRAKPGVVLICDAADPALDLGAVVFREILNDIELDISAPFAGEALHRVNVADGLERFAHQDQAFFFNVDDPLTGLSIGFIRKAADRPSRRARHVQQERHSDIALAAQLASVEPVVDQSGRPFVQGVVYDCLQVVVFSVNLAANLAQVFGPQELKLVSNRRDDSGIAAANHLDEAAGPARAGPLYDAAPACAVISEVAVPLVVIIGFVTLLQVLLGCFGAGELAEQVAVRAYLLGQRRRPKAEGIFLDFDLAVGPG